MDGLLPRSSGPAAAATVALVLLLALLLALAPVAALPLASSPPDASPPSADREPTLDSPRAVPSLGEPVSPRDGTTAYLAIPEDEMERSALAVVSLDGGGATAVSQSRLESRFVEYRLHGTFQRATTTEERRDAVRDGLETLRDRVAELEARERAALVAYNRGTLSTQAYLRELAAVNVGAETLTGTATRLYEYTEALPDSTVSPSDIAAVKVRLLTLRGPVRAAAAGTMGTGGPPARFYVETSDSGVVLAMVTGEEFNRQYVREAYLPEARAPEASDRYLREGQYDLEAAENRARELYPWAFANHGGISTGVRTGQPYLYRAATYSVAIDHPQGTPRQGDLVTYLDGGTGEVFREVQYKDVSEVPTDPPATNVSRNVSDGLLLQVNRTRTGGPVEIHVRDAEDGSPVNATVSLDGVVVATTGSDGRAWTVAPRRSFTVTVVADGRTASAGPMPPG
jgi:hypothetical protein